MGGRWWWIVVIKGCLWVIEKDVRSWYFYKKNLGINPNHQIAFDRIV